MWLTYLLLCYESTMFVVINVFTIASNFLSYHESNVGKRLFKDICTFYLNNSVI